MRACAPGHWPSSSIHLSFRKADLPTALISYLYQLPVLLLATFLTNSDQHRGLWLLTNRLHEHKSSREPSRAEFVIAC